MEENYSEDYNPLTDIAIRLNEIEEKQRLIKDRAILIGENLISTKEEMLKNEIETRKQLKQISEEIKLLKNTLNRLIEEISNFARKSELEIIERQIKIFEPLKIARLEDVETMINKKLNIKTMKSPK